jgi:Mg/Co/Ni transporter MgtE
MAAQSKTDLVIASVRRLLRVGATANLLNLLQKRHPVDIAEILRALNDHERRAAVDAMAAADPRLAMQVVAELGVDMGAALLASRPAREIVRLLQELAPDDAAALIDRFPEPLADEVREQMRGQHPTAEIAEVLGHREGTAGRIMNPRVFALPEDTTAGEAVNAIQQLGGIEMSFYLYVIDERRHLVGVVSLRRLLLFVPLIISSGGNSGSQAASLIIRALAVGEVTLRDWWRIMRREVLSGLALGVILGSVGFIRVSLWQQLFGTYGAHWFLIALTVLFALVGVVMWGTIAGSMLPFLMKRLGADPATSSAPFVATLVDVTGLVIYFTVAATILRGTLL